MIITGGIACYKSLDLIEAVASVAGTQAQIMIEMHGRFAPFQVREIVNQIKKYNIGWIEEPVRPGDIPALSSVRNDTSLPIAIGERLYGSPEFREVWSSQNVDILQPDILNAGGPSEVKRIFEIANNLNKPVMPHSPQAGINSIASIQVYSTVQNATRPHEFSTEFSGDLNEIAELYGNHVIPENGEIKINDKPGLGIELNENLIQKFKL